MISIDDKFHLLIRPMEKALYEYIESLNVAHEFGMDEDTLWHKLGMGDVSVETLTTSDTVETIHLELIERRCYV